MRSSRSGWREVKLEEDVRWGWNVGLGGRLAYPGMLCKWLGSSGCEIVSSVSPDAFFMVWKWSLVGSPESSTLGIGRAIRSGW